MQINKIGQAQSFKGLWERKYDSEVMGQIKTEGYSRPVYKKDLVYHPFEDESVEEIAEKIKSIEGKNIKVIVDSREDIVPCESKAPEGYVVLNPVLGSTLGITKSEFEAMKKMRENLYPFCDQDYMDASESEKELISKLNHFS